MFYRQYKLLIYSRYLINNTDNEFEQERFYKKLHCRNGLAMAPAFGPIP